jgi:hypothetical protein
MQRLLTHAATMPDGALIRIYAPSVEKRGLTRSLYHDSAMESYLKALQGIMLNLADLTYEAVVIATGAPYSTTLIITDTPAKEPVPDQTSVSVVAFHQGAGPCSANAQV